MKYKVLVDTNVLISASIYMDLKGSSQSIRLQHPFFDSCMQLLGLLRKHTPKHVGIVTATIENEAIATLERAVEIEVGKSKLPRETLFEALSLVLTKCQDRMQNLVQSLQRDAIRSEDLAPYKTRVVEMYDEFIYEAEEIDVKSEASAKTDLAAPRFKPVAYQIYKDQGRMLNRQVQQLRYDRPNDRDKQILAEAAYLSRSYRESEGKVEFYFASCDTHFSPMTGKGGGLALASRDVTDRINQDFSVICDWPTVIASTLAKNL